jgi:hypothetical protein
LERRACDLIEVLSWHFPGGTEENNKEVQSLQPVSRPEFERTLPKYNSADYRSISP